MKLKDKKLEKILAYKVGKFSGEEISEKELSSIEEVNISNRNFSGEDIGVSLQELALCPGIRNMSLQYFTIDDNIVDILNGFEFLDTVQLSSCKFIAKKKLKNPSIKCLTLNCCDIGDYDLISAPSVLRVIGQEDFRFDELEGRNNIEKLYIQASTVKGFSSITDCNKLETLNLDGSKVDDSTTLEELKKRIQVSQLDEYMPMR